MKKKYISTKLTISVFFFIFKTNDRCQKGSRTKKQRAARFLRRANEGEGAANSPRVNEGEGVVNPPRQNPGAGIHARNNYRPILERRPTVPPTYIQRVEPCTPRRPPREENDEPEIIILEEPAIEPVPAAVPPPLLADNNQAENEVIIINELPQEFVNLREQLLRRGRNTR